VTPLVGGALGVAAVLGFLWLVHALPAHWFDDRALTRPMELPDQEMRDALEEVDRLAPAAPRVAPLPLRWSIDEVRRKIAERQLPAPPPDVPDWSRIERRPPPPPPMPTRAPGRGIIGGG